MSTNVAASTSKRRRIAAAEQLSGAEARVLQTALEENGIRWGQSAMDANIYRRDAAMRLERAGMLARVKALFPIRSQWILTELGRDALANHQQRSRSSTLQEG